MSKIAQVIPAVRLKRSLNYFDYAVPDEMQAQIKIGQIVEIPFRNQNVKGVVFTLPKKSESTYDLKPITKIIDPLPYLSSWQLELIKFTAEYYFVSMAMVLKMVLPEIPNRKSGKFKVMRMDFVSNKTDAFDILDIFTSLNPLLLTYSNFANKISIYSHIIKHNIDQGKQTAIIVPELINLEQIYKYFGDYKDSISILLNDLPKNKFWQEWLKIKNGTTKVIIGTRSAIFAPFKDLGALIIDEEDNPNHKQEEPNPRYNVKTIALQIGKLTGAKIIFSALTPSLNSLYKVQTKDWEYLELDKPKELPQITVIDRQDEFKKGNFAVISEKLQHSLEANLQQKKQTFLFLNRKGSATLLTCKDCGYTASCPTCHLPLTYYKKKGSLQCHHCDYKIDLYLVCPKCQSPEIKLTGIGTEKVEFDLQKQFPEAKITVIDQTNQNQIQINDADIIIGTQFALSYVNWKKIQTIGMINCDTLFYVPDYRSVEKTFNLIYKMILNLPDENKEIICQTMVPENYIFAALKQASIRDFYIREIKERQELRYPPFCKLIKLIYQSFDFNGGQEEIEEVYKVIKSKVESNENIIINFPALTYTQQVRGRFRWQIIIKILDLKPDLKFLNELPENIIFDVDPENLL